MIRLQRIYDPPAPDDGERYLVERLWPRGVSRPAARLAGWLKDLAPSPALRQWFHQDFSRWEEFQKRYRAELRAPEKQEALRKLAGRAARRPVTLVFAARDRERNSAVVLARHLLELGSGPAGRSPGRMAKRPRGSPP